MIFFTIAPGLLHTTEYLETWRNEERHRDMKVTMQKIQIMDFNFEQKVQGNREPVNILAYLFA